MVKDLQFINDHGLANPMWTKLIIVLGPGGGLCVFFLYCEDPHGHGLRCAQRACEGAAFFALSDCRAALNLGLFGKRSNVSTYWMLRSSVSTQ